MKYYLALKRKEILPFPSMDEPGQHGQRAEDTKPDTEGQDLHDLNYKWNLEKLSQVQ